MAQARIPGMLPSPEDARRRHKAAVKAEREAEKNLGLWKESGKVHRDALKTARAHRLSAEDDLDAIEEGRRPERGGRTDV
jgi:hypothetical protein